VQTTAAILGGADAITTLPYDAAWGGHSSRGRRVARNTQAVLGQESRLGQIADPMGGSYALEALTEALARAAWDLFRRLDGTGMAANLLDPESGDSVQSMVAASLQRHQERLRDHTDELLGVTRYPAPEDDADAAVEKASQTAAVSTSDGAGEGGGLAQRAACAPEVLRRIRKAAELAGVDADPARLMRALVDAAREGATLAELTHALRSEPGETAMPILSVSDEDLVEQGQAEGS